MLQAFDATTGAAMPHSGAALWLGLRTVRNLRKGLTWAWRDTICQYRRRGPLLGEVPPFQTYVIVLAVTVVGYALAYLAYRRMRRDLAFFV